MEKIINSLKKCRIDTSRPTVKSVLALLGRHERNLEVGSVNTDLALYTYENVRDAAGTETKTCIGAEIEMKVNGSVFDDFPFILSAHDSAGALRLVKILRVPERDSQLSVMQQEMQFEVESVKFEHNAIVPMECKSINIDMELAKKASCRVGVNQVMIMPWYTSTLNKQPSNDLVWIAREGKRVLEALQYLHTHQDGPYVHLDVKAANVFVDHNGRCFLGDFGSCKPMGATVTSCTTTFCWEDIRGQTAHPKHDYFMFLHMVLIECLEDRRTYSTIFYDAGATHASVSRVLGVAQTMLVLDTTPPALKALLVEVLTKLGEFQLT